MLQPPQLASDLQHAVEDAAAHLYVWALKDIPQDLRDALSDARHRETSIPGKRVLETIHRNINVADSENMTFLKMLTPADGVKGIKQFVLESIVGAGGKPCPPGIVGVGIGGSADYAMALAKDAIMRPIGTRNSDPLVAELEDELMN